MAAIEICVLCGKGFHYQDKIVGLWGSRSLDGRLPEYAHFWCMVRVLLLPTDINATRDPFWHDWAQEREVRSHLGR